MRKFVIALGLAASASLTAHVVPGQETKAAEGGLAASSAACTGKPETECGATAGCAWLPGYKVANGGEIPGYCRAAPKPLTARRGPQAQGR